MTCIGFGLDGFGFGFGGWGLIFNRAAGLLEFVLEGLKERGEMPGPPRPSAHGLLAGRRRSVSMSLLPGPAWHRACHAASTDLCAGRIASSSIHLGPVWFATTSSTHASQKKNLQCMEYETKFICKTFSRMGVTFHDESNDSN